MRLKQYCLTGLNYDPQPFQCALQIEKHENLGDQTYFVNQDSEVSSVMLHNAYSRINSDRSTVKGFVLPTDLSFQGSIFQLYRKLASAS